jgi:hypothetical protein
LSAAEEEEESDYAPVDKPGTAYIRVHPLSTYELCWAFTHDFRKSDGKRDPYLVLQGLWSKFPPALIRVKRLLLCQKFVDDGQHWFLWLADWHEKGDVPSELHKSVARVISRARAEWGQALYDARKGIYTWRRWSTALGEPPLDYWPEKPFFNIVNETFEGRIVDSPTHELILAIGEES